MKQPLEKKIKKCRFEGTDFPVALHKDVFRSILNFLTRRLNLLGSRS